MKLVRTEVTNLEQNVEAIKKSNADEAKRIGEALQDAIDEIAKFEKRIADMESRLEEEHQAQSEKNKEFSSAIEDISNNIYIYNRGTPRYKRTKHFFVRRKAK